MQAISSSILWSLHTLELSNVFGNLLRAFSALLYASINSQNFVVPIDSVRINFRRDNFSPFEDELYPPLLRNIPDPPPVLSFLGNRERVLSFYQKNMISVVGARNASIHSNRFCDAMCQNLGKNDVVIVSGLARGIYASAHN